MSALVPHLNDQPWIAALASPGALGDGAPLVIETHISVVLLAGSRALKFKKAVKLPFLDYRTQTQRARMALREFWINRLFAPPLYLGVRPVLAREPARGAGPVYRLGPLLAPEPAVAMEEALAALEEREGLAAALSFRPAGGERVVDWVVEMRRFAAAQRWDRLAVEGGLSPSDIDAFGDVIIANHRRAPRHPDRPAGERLLRGIDDVIAALKAEGGGPWGDTQRLAAHHGRLGAALGRGRARLEARRRRGAQRRCHGDMHLANICNFGGRPYPFDAIEFSDDIAIIDCAYDLAFPVMDLLARGRREAAWRLFNRVLEASGDLSSLSLWPLFMALRATIRAMAEWGAGRKREALAYRDLAGRLLDEAGRPPRPLWIAIGGLSGSGKSTLARALGPELGPQPGALWLRSDGIRKRLFARRPEERLPPEAYSESWSVRCYRRLLSRARAAARAGWPAVCDATWLHPESQAALKAQARRLGVRLERLWLDAPQDVLRARIAARRGDSSDADAAVLAGQLAGYRGPPAGWRVLPATRAPAALAAEIKALIGCG